MTPVRVSAPAGPLVPLADLKKALRVDTGESDAIIQRLEAAAVAHLDGWRGALGRCIGQQTWRVSPARAGTFALPFPDVISVEGAEWLPSCRYITVEQAGDVTFTCALPEDALDVVRQAITIWVQMRYDGVTGPAADAYQRAFDGLIDPLRWIG